MITKGKQALEFNLNKQAASDEIEVKKVKSNDIAIIGMSARFPAADNLDEFWINLENGMDCIKDVPEGRALDYFQNGNKLEKMKKGYLTEIDKFDCSYFSIIHNEAVLMDPNQRLLLETAMNAIDDSGYSQEMLKNTKTGVFVGFSNDLNEAYKDYCMEQHPEWVSRGIAGNLKSVIASRIAYYLDLKGPSMVIDTACSSSLVALHLACQSLKEKECEMAIVGSSNLDIIHTIDLEMNIGVRSNDGRVRAFDEAADGTGDGEGVIAVVVKRLEDALRDCDHICAVVKGSAVNQDGQTIGITAPNPEAQSQVIMEAWRNARVNPETITYIEAHGTGTKIGDPIEIKGIQQAFEKYTHKKQFCTIGSVKNNIGHLGCASGLAGVVKAVLSLNRKKIPPHINLQYLSHKIVMMDSALYINQEAIDWKVTGGKLRCGISSFGMSGTNCHVVLEEAPQIKRSEAAVRTWNAFCLSARDEVQLKEQIKSYVEYLKRIPEADFMNVCYTVSTGRKHHPYRLTVISNSLEDLKKKFFNMQMNLLEADEEASIFYSHSSIIHQNEEKKKSYEIYSHEKEEYSKKANHLLQEKNQSYDTLCQVAKLYVKGADVAWKLFYQEKRCYKISLPGYPFLKTRCWVESVRAIEYEVEPAQTIKHQIKEKNEMESREKESNDTADMNLFECIKQGVKEIVSNSIGVSAISINIYTNFFEIGLDSILLLDIISKIEKKFGVRIPGEEFFGEVNNVHAVAAYVLNHMPQQNSVQSVAVQEKVTEKSYLEKHQNQLLESNLYWAVDNSVMHVFMQQMDIMKEQLNLLKNSSNIPIQHEGIELRQNVPKKSKLASKKKAVVPFAAISLEEDPSLMSCKQEYIQQFILDYNKRTEKSKEYAKISRLTLANNRNTAGFKPNVKEMLYPIVCKSAYGSKMVDIDDNEYIDLTMGFGVNLFGHNPSFITEKLIETLHRSITLGPVSDTAYRAAKVISKLTGVERVAFYNSGTEANMVAVRLSRSATKKKKIVTFSGSYHGTYDGFSCTVDEDAQEIKSVPIAPGIVESVVQDTVVLVYDDESSLEYIKENADEIAAVFVEPVQSRRPDLQPRDFIHKIRKITEENKIVLVFDEMITGFRIQPGGAQRFFGIQADLVTYGKIIGGGMPIGVVAGKSEIMDGIDGGVWNFGDKSYPANAARRTLVAGTFCQHPLAMAAVIATGNYLLEKGSKLQNTLNLRTLYLVNRLNSIFQEVHVPVKVVHFGSLFRFQSRISLDMFFYHLVYHGIYVWEGRNCFLSTAHTEDDIDRIVETVRAVVQTLVQEVFWKETNLVEQNEDWIDYPLTYEQENFYVMFQLKKLKLTYNMTSARKIKGNIDYEKVENCFQTLIDRHEALRTTFHMIQGNVVQRVHAHIDFAVEYYESTEQDYMQVEAKFCRIFDLETAPLIRVALVKIAENEHILLVDMHHIISDGQSTNVLVEEFAKLYAGISLGPVQRQLKDFALEQRESYAGADFEKSKEFWYNMYKEKAVALDFPLDYERYEEQTFDSGNLIFVFDEKLTAELKELAKQCKCTLYAVLFALYNILLSKYTSKEDIIVGMPVLGRNKDIYMQTIGMFINTLPVRSYPKKEFDFKEYLNIVNKQIQDSYNHQSYPMAFLIQDLNIESTTNKNTLFDTMFVMNNEVTGSSARLNDLEITSLKRIEKGSRVDIQMEAHVVDNQIEFTIIYSKSLLKQKTVNGFAKKFTDMVNEVIKNSSLKIKDLKGNLEQMNQLLLMFNEEI